MKGAGSYFKLSLSSLALVLIFFCWEFFYSFVGPEIRYVSFVREMFSTLLESINWDNLFVKGASMILIWLVVAMIVFLFFVLTESFSVFLHNKRVEATYVNKPRDDLAHLLKEREQNVIRHLPYTSWLSGGIVILLFALFVLSDLVDLLRSYSHDFVLLRLSNAGNITNIHSSVSAALSFVFVIPIWYFISVLVLFCFSRSRDSRVAETIEEEHYGAVIDGQ